MMTEFQVCSQYATCINTIGSYRCDCKDGFTLSPSPQQMCTDINECEPNGGIGPCEHKCINTWGAYRCACNKGFRLQSDNRYYIIRIILKLFTTMDKSWKKVNWVTHKCQIVN